MRCPNCNNEIADHLTVCWICNSNLINLENFLNKKNKILVIIGVFGALSIYFMQTAFNYNNNFFLELGSGISLLVMVILSLVIISDCYSFIKKYPNIPQEQDKQGYYVWIKHTINLLSLWAFLLGVLIIVFSVLVFVLIYSKISEIALIFTGGFAFIFILVAFLLLPSDAIVKKSSFPVQLMVCFLFSLLVAIWFSYVIRDLSKFDRVSFTTDLIVWGLVTCGWINAIIIIIKRAEENWDSLITFLTKHRTCPAVPREGP